MIDSWITMAWIDNMLNHKWLAQPNESQELYLSACKVHKHYTESQMFSCTSPLTHKYNLI